jgi:uncharacterized repeat protein (TIGR01451 family)
MRYFKITSLAFFLSMTAVAVVYAQEDEPRRLRRPLEVLSLDHQGASQVVSANEASEAAGVIGNTTLPQVDNDGHVRDGGLAERLQAMRRRAVDINLSRSFFTDPNAQTVQHEGELPAVPRRPAGKPAPVPTNIVPEGPAAAAEEASETPVPTPAPQPVPSPAMDAVNIPTRPMTPTAPATQTTPEIQAQLPVATKTAPAAETAAAPEIAPAPEIVPVEAPALDVGGDGAVLLTNRAPAITFETMGPRKIVIGQETNFKVRMINMGDVAARNVIVTVRMPAWAEVNSNSATRGTPLSDSAGDLMSTVTWELSELAAGGSETLTLGIVPRDSRPIDLAVGWAFNPEQATAQIEVQEPMLKMDITGPSDVNYGESAAFSITLSNPGTGDASNVVLNLMPSSQQRVTGSREIGTLKMGERKTIEIELTAHQAGRLQVRAMAHADGGLRDESSKDVVVRRANLQMVLLGPPRNFAASTAAYKVKIENTGDAVAEEAVAVATLPAGATFISASDSGSYSEERGQVHWQIGALPPGTARVLQLQCELHSSGENRMDVHCEAARDLSIAKSVVTHVEALADLKLYVNDPKGAIAVGDNATYEVRIENRGTKAAEMVQVIGYFSEGIEPVAVRGLSGEVATGQVVMDPIAAIEAGQNVVLHISAKANRPGNHVFRVELQCSQPETRLASEEWTKYYSAAGGVEVRQAMVPLEVKTDADGQTFQIETH